jgi:hypothetical protein
MAALVRTLSVELADYDYGEINAIAKLTSLKQARGPNGEMLVLRDCGANDNTCLLLSVLYSLFGCTQHYVLCRAVCAFGLIAHAHELIADPSTGGNIEFICEEDVVAAFDNVVAPEIVLLRTKGSGLEAVSASAAALALGVPIAISMRRHDQKAMQWDVCTPKTLDHHWPAGALPICVWHTGNWHYVAGLRVSKPESYKPVFAGWPAARITDWLSSKLSEHIASAQASRFNVVKANVKRLETWYTTHGGIPKGPRGSVKPIMDAARPRMPPVPSVKRVSKVKTTPVEITCMNSYSAAPRTSVS